ncbi:MAG: hypothetical protein ABSF08_12180, partial [Candidatus Cybelea sp.]
YSLTPQSVDEMLVAMRAGTYSTAPMAQTEVPGRTWTISQESEISRGKKSSGAVDVPLPNNAGGVGDRSGIIMLDRIVNRDVDFFTKTSERAVVDARQVVEVREEEGSHAGH